jgi:hypothetical protein
MIVIKKDAAPNLKVIVHSSPSGSVIDGRVKSVCEPGATVNGVKVYEKMGGP